MNWAKLSGKFSRYNSREPESSDIDKGKVEFRTSVSGEAHVNYASNENHEFLLTNQNGGSYEFQFIDDDIMPESNVIIIRGSYENNITRVSHAKPNDYVDYSKFSPIQTKDSPNKAGRLSSELEDSRVEPTETQTNPETVTIPTVGAQINKENGSTESIKDSTESIKDSTESIQDPPAEPVKKRKKKFKLRHVNKIHSSPGRNNEQEIKVGQQETDKRKTY